MARAPTFCEHEIVSLCEKVGGWPAGTMGTVVSDCGASFLVEIADLTGKALAFIRVPATSLAHRR